MKVKLKKDTNKGKAARKKRTPKANPPAVKTEAPKSDEKPKVVEEPKKSVVTKGVEETEVTPEPEPMRISELESSHLFLHKARIDQQNTVLENLALKREMAAIEYKRKDAEFKMQQRTTAQSVGIARSDYQKVVKSIEERLGVNLKDYVIQDDLSLEILEEEIKEVNPITGKGGEVKK